MMPGLGLLAANRAGLETPSFIQDAVANVIRAPGPVKEWLQFAFVCLAYADTTIAALRMAFQSSIPWSCYCVIGPFSDPIRSSRI